MNQLHYLLPQAEVFIAKNEEQKGELRRTYEADMVIHPENQEVLSKNVSENDSLFQAMRVQASITDTIRLRIVRDAMHRLQEQTVDKNREI